MHEISLWLESMGIPPLLGGLIAGAVLVWVLSRLGSGDKSAAVLGAGSRSNSPARRSGTRTRGAGEAEAPNRPEQSGDGVDLSERELAVIFQHLQQGEKIAAIKLLRERTGMGLAEAKNFVEALEDRGVAR